MWLSEYGSDTCIVSSVACQILFLSPQVMITAIYQVDILTKKGVTVILVIYIFHIFLLLIELMKIILETK